MLATELHSFIECRYGCCLYDTRKGIRSAKYRRKLKMRNKQRFARDFRNGEYDY